GGTVGAVEFHADADGIDPARARVAAADVRQRVQGILNVARDGAANRAPKNGRGRFADSGLADEGEGEGAAGHIAAEIEDLDFAGGAGAERLDFRADVGGGAGQVRRIRGDESLGRIGQGPLENDRDAVEVDVPGQGLS